MHKLRQFHAKINDQNYFFNQIFKIRNLLHMSDCPNGFKVMSPLWMRRHRFGFARKNNNTVRIKQTEKNASSSNGDARFSSSEKCTENSI